LSIKIEHYDFWPLVAMSTIQALTSIASHALQFQPRL